VKWTHAEPAAESAQGERRILLGIDAGFDVAADAVDQFGVRMGANRCIGLAAQQGRKPARSAASRSRKKTTLTRRGRRLGRMDGSRRRSKPRHRKRSRPCGNRAPAWLPKRTSPKSAFFGGHHPLSLGRVTERRYPELAVKVRWGALFSRTAPSELVVQLVAGLYRGMDLSMPQRIG